MLLANLAELPLKQTCSDRRDVITSRTESRSRIDSNNDSTTEKGKIPILVTNGAAFLERRRLLFAYAVVSFLKLD